MLAGSFFSYQVASFNLDMRVYAYFYYVLLYYVWSISPGRCSILKRNRRAMDLVGEEKRED